MITEYYQGSTRHLLPTSLPSYSRIGGNTMKASFPTRQKGASLLVGLILLLVATIVVFAGMRGTQMQERMTSNLNNKAISYMAAEAGASTFAQWYFGEFAANRTPGPASNPPPPATGNVGGGEGRFTIAAVDWVSRPGGVSFVSIGESVNAGLVLGESRLRVELEGPSGDWLLPPEAAYQCFGEYCTTATGSNSSSKVYYDGRDWALPVSASCTGSGCDGTLTNNPGTFGVYLVGNIETGAISTGNQAGDSQPGQIQGEPKPREQTNLRDENDLFKSIAGTTTQDWNNLVAELFERFPPTVIDVTNATKKTEIPSADLGSRSSPTVLHVKAGKDTNLPYKEIQVTKNTHGAGVMVIDGDIDFTTAAGTSTFEGLIILRNGAKLTGGSGTFNVFGSIISLEGQQYAPDAKNVLQEAVDADLGGNFTLKYSGSALDNVRENFGGKETILTWIEQVGS
jgi:hypothetical protein